MKSITVFCGSSLGADSIYAAHAIAFGETLSKYNIDLVYGGAKVGLMGVIADAVLNGGGKVIGVLPHFLKTKEIAHEQLSELILVNSMHERKMKMYELCNGIIALPGGFGTMEELFEMLTWAQLGLHQKPIGILNINGFYKHLLEFIQSMVDAEFLKPINQHMLLTSEYPDELIQKMKQYEAPIVSKWIQNENV